MLKLKGNYRPLHIKPYYPMNNSLNSETFRLGHFIWVSKIPEFLSITKSRIIAVDFFFYQIKYIAKFCVIFQYYTNIAWSKHIDVLPCHSCSSAFVWSIYLATNSLTWTYIKQNSAIKVKSCSPLILVLHFKKVDIDEKLAWYQKWVFVIF